MKCSILGKRKCFFGYIILFVYFNFTSHYTAKAALEFGSEAWVLKEREEQRLEAAQMKFLRHLLGITKLDKVKNQCIRGKKREHKT